MAPSHRALEREAEQRAIFEAIHETQTKAAAGSLVASARGRQNDAGVSATQLQQQRLRYHRRFVDQQQARLRQLVEQAVRRDETGVASGVEQHSRGFPRRRADDPVRRTAVCLQQQSQAGALAPPAIRIEQDQAVFSAFEPAFDDAQRASLFVGTAVPNRCDLELRQARYRRQFRVGGDAQAQPSVFRDRRLEIFGEAQPRRAQVILPESKIVVGRIAVRRGRSENHQHAAGGQRAGRDTQCIGIETAPAIEDEAGMLGAQQEIGRLEGASRR